MINEWGGGQTWVKELTQRIGSSLNACYRLQWMHLTMLTIGMWQKYMRTKVLKLKQNTSGSLVLNMNKGYATSEGGF